MLFRNYTPHMVNIIVGNKVKHLIQPEGIPIRVKEEQVFSHYIEGTKIPVYKVRYGEVENLPEKEVGVLLIVSLMIKQACPDRDDLISPLNLVRDDKGNIVGCSAFQ